MDIVRYARIGALTAVFAIPFVVLIVAQSMYFPFITGKGFTFRILVEIAFAFWVVLALYSAEYRPRKSLALWLGLAFLISIGISTVLAENPVKAFWSNFERMEGYILILHLAMYVVVLTTVINTEKLWRNLMLTSLGAATIVGIYSVFQLLGAATINQGGLRIDATLGNATYFAVYMLIHAFIALYVYVRWTGENRWLRIGLGTLFALCSILVFYSATRGSILGLVGGLGLAGLIVAFSRNTNLRYMGMGIIALIIVLIVGFWVVKDTAYVQEHPILSRVASISLASGEVRFTIWGMALQGAAERPLFGWGQEGFNYVFNTYYRPELVTQEPWFDRAHNVVLDWLIAGGVIGMLLYVSLYVVLLYYLWRPQSGFDVSERAILTGLIAAYSFHNLFVFDNLLSYILFMMLFSYITVRAQGAREGAPQQTVLGTEISMPLTLVSLLVVMYVVNWSGYASATGVIQGLSPQPEGLEKNLQYFTEAARRTGHGYQEVGEQFLQFAMQVRGLNVGDDVFQARTMQEARTAFDGVLAQAPRDSRLLVFYGSFLRQMGDAEGARTYATKALELSPKKQSIKLELGILEIAQRKFDVGLPLLKEVYDVAPRYGNVHVYYSAALILAGKVEDSQKVLMESFNTLEPLDATIASAYLQANKYAEAKAIALKLTEANPSLDTYKFLGGVLIEGGETQAAIAALERAKQLDPRFAPEADAYITKLRTGVK